MMMKLRIGLSALAFCMAVPALGQEVADRIWSGGPILTMNDAAMRAELQRVVAINLAAVGLSALGLAGVVAGILLG